MTATIQARPKISKSIQAGLLIHRLRKRMGIRQIALSQQLGIYQSSLSKIEKGGPGGLKHLSKVVAIFNEWRTNEIARLDQDIKDLQEFKTTIQEQ